ncbi:MAG: glycosyltransferase [Thaumarchaeota archaeon]|nr:glycosyltransferase [Nitrososphaerota archaeon]
MSVIIPTRNRTDKLARCLESVYKSDYGKLEVIVVDDASENPASGVLSGKFPNARFIRNSERMLLSYSRNSGAAASTGDYLFFLDDDNVIAPDTIRLLAETLGESEGVAVSSPIIFYLSRPATVWTSYISRSKFPGFYTLHTDIPSKEVATFSFHNSFMVKKKVFVALDGFDYANLPIRFGEVDFAHRVSASGYAAVVNPRAKDWHDLGWTTVHIDSTRAYYTERNRIIVIKRYFKKRDLTFYLVCILPFIGGFYLLHHPLSTTDGRSKTASSFLRGIAAGLVFKEPDEAKAREMARGRDGTARDEKFLKNFKRDSVESF